MSYMDKLKPCPFCGNEVRLYKRDYIVDKRQIKYCYIKCKNADCSVNPRTRIHYTEQEAIEAWNTRKGEENG